MSSDASSQWIGQTPNPFAHDVETAVDEYAGDESAALDLHAGTLGRCLRVLDDLSEKAAAGILSTGAPARSITIGAPRAGYGKTHLVGRLMSKVGDRAVLVPMVFDVSEPVSWQNLLRRVLRYFERNQAPVTDSRSHSLWQETGRRLYAEVFLSAADAGEVKKEMPAGRGVLLRNFISAADPGDRKEEAPVVDRAIFLRDFCIDLAPGVGEGDGARVRDWIVNNCDRLTQMAAEDVCGRWQIDPQAFSSWTAAFRRSALETVPADERATILRSLIPNSEAADAEVQAKQRLGELLRMASACRPLVLVVDHLDGFFGDQSVVLPLANTITSLRSMVRRGLLLLCINRDLRESIFEGALPSALADRLNSESATLASISGQQARELVERRLLLAGVDSAHAAEFVQQLARVENWADPGTEGLYPRGVLRRAAAMWEANGETEDAGDAGYVGAINVVAEKPAGQKAETPSELRGAPSQKLDAGQAAAGKKANLGKESAAVLLPVPGGTASMARSTATEVSALGEAPQRFHRAALSSSHSESSAEGGAMTDLQSIVSDIRSGGARAVSEGPSAADLKSVPREAVVASARPSSPASGGAMNGSSAMASSRRVLAPSGADASEVSANEAELRRRVAAFRSRSTGGGLPWVMVKLERLISAVGARYSAVAQSCPQIGGQTCLRWTVRGEDVLMGFAAAEDSGYWKRLAARTASGNRAKLVAFVAGGSDTPDFGSLVEDAADVIQLQDDDLALLYAGDDMIAESSADHLDERVRFVARRMDPFWRRVTRAL